MLVLVNCSFVAAIVTGIGIEVATLVKEHGATLKKYLGHRGGCLGVAKAGELEREVSFDNPLHQPSRRRGSTGMQRDRKEGPGGDDIELQAR